MHKTSAIRPPQRKLIYQIYPTAIGDLAAISEKIPLIAELQPDYIWLSPIFDSPWREGGYDVANYTKINPRFGNLSDFKHLISVAKHHNIGILLDLVLNHTSTEHEWFQKSRHRDPRYSDYYIWLEKPLNWRSFFGGPAYEYDPIRGEYYLHLFDKSQPDLNFENPRVIKEFAKIIDYWVQRGVAGFRIDSANVLSESKLQSGFFPCFPGFFNYFQTKSTIKILDRLLNKPNIFTIAEPIGGELLSKKKFRELTNAAFDAGFNIGTLDIADSFFSDKAHPLPVNYARWFRKLSRWVTEPKFSFALESHDTPRSVTRFHSQPKPLAMLQFLLPNNFPCIYQGQEIGTPNPHLGNSIEDFPGVQSRAVFQQLLHEGHSKRSAMRTVHRISRENSRQPIDWTKYRAETKDPNSTLCFYRHLTEMWRQDPVLIYGDFKVKRISRTGVFDFVRRYDRQTYFIHIDLSSRTASTVIDQNGKLILSSRKSPHKHEQ